MIHWDWVWTVCLISILTSIVSIVTSASTEPLKTERMKAETALLEAKRLNKIRGVN